MYRGDLGTCAQALYRAQAKHTLPSGELLAAIYQTQHCEFGSYNREIVE